VETRRQRWRRYREAAEMDADERETMGHAFTVPGAPRPKGRARVTRSGHAYTPGRTRSYEALVATVAMAAGVDAKLKLPLLTSSQAQQVVAAAIRDHNRERGHTMQGFHTILEAEIAPNTWREVDTF
jgi:hypothetical protein